MSYETYEVQVHSNGTQRWYQNDKLHRADGPAVIYTDGTQFWFLNDMLHRADGPASLWADGFQFWWLNGETMSEAEHAAAVAKSQSPCDGKAVEINGKTVEIDGKKYKLTAV